MVAGHALSMRRPVTATGAAMAGLGAIFLLATSYLAIEHAAGAGGAGPAPGVDDLARLSPGERAEARRAAEAAFLHTPLSAAAILELARLAELDGDGEASERLRLMAGDVTPRSPQVQAEALAILLRRRDFDAVMSRLDGLIRARPADAARFYALAAELSADPDGARAVARMMATDPPWRGQFLSALIAAGQADAASRVMDEMRGMDAPVADGERAALIGAYLRADETDRAYAAWLSSLGEDELKDVRRVYDGGFRHPVRSLRFDWTVAPASGLSYRIFPRNTASMDQTLQIDLHDFAGSFSHLTQLLRLGPGRYRLSGEVRFEGFTSATGLVFRLYCVAKGSPRLLDETTPLPQSTQWITFEKTFDLADRDCPLQSLQLESRARLSPEQLSRGMIAIDNIAIDSLPPLAP